MVALALLGGLALLGSGAFWTRGWFVESSVIAGSFMVAIRSQVNADVMFPLRGEAVVRLYALQFSDDSLSLEEIERLFYRQLNLIEKDLEVSEIARKKACELLRTKKDDIKKVEKMWGQQDQRSTLRDRTNDIPVPSGSETVAASAAPSKKRKTSVEEGAASSDRQLELPLKFGHVKLEELNLSHKLELPKLIRDYLTKNKMPNKGPEGDVQKWFNGLMKEMSSLWTMVTAADTHNSCYLSGYKPDISVVGSEEAELCVFDPSKVYTLLELKRIKTGSGLTDEDK
ncbi:3744_t:CDS:2, partial [Gigaspora margarita]